MILRGGQPHVVKLEKRSHCAVVWEASMMIWVEDLIVNEVLENLIKYDVFN